jgi:hypothetical protein
MSTTDRSSILPRSEPFGRKSTVVNIDIYRDGSRVMTLPSGFRAAKIVLVETPDYQLRVDYKSNT